MIMRRAAVSSFLLVAVWSSRASAELTFTPSIMVREEYNDNIDLTRDNRIEDFITSVNPSLGISLKTSIIELSADYGLHFRFFAKHSDRNETDLTQTQRVKADTTLTVLPDRFFIKLADVYERVPIDQRRQVAFDSIYANLTDSNRFTANPYLQYPITSTLIFNAGYTFQDIWYDDPEGDDSQSHTATAGLIKQFGERLSLFGNYSYRWYKPQRTQQYESGTAMVGASVQVTPKLSVSGSVGQVEYKYEAVEFSPPLRIIDRKNRVYYVITELPARTTSSVIWNAQASYLFTERIKLNAGYAQSFADSVNEGNVKSRSLTGSVGYDAKIPMTLSGFFTDSTYALHQRRDRSAGGVLGLGIPLTSSITLKVDGNFSHLNFDPEGEKVDRYGVRTGFDFEIVPQGIIGVGYTYNRENSNVDENDYSNNIAFLQARYTF